MIELEILVEINELYEKAKSKLSKYNFTKETLMEDIYFYDPLRQNLKPNEIGKTFECLRIRNYDNESKITYKQDVYEKDVWQYSNENEISVDNFKEAEHIFNCLGLKKLLTIRNKRRFYIYNNYEIVLEKVDDLGTFLEVEYKGTLKETQIVQEKNKIWEFIKSLGLQTSNELNAGKPELYIIKHNIKV